MASPLHTRINRIIGQLQGIQKMMNTDQKCEKIAIQFKAAKSALDSAFRDFLHQGALNCPKDNPDLLKKMLDMVIK